MCCCRWGNMGQAGMIQKLERDTMKLHFDLLYVIIHQQLQIISDCLGELKVCAGAANAIYCDFKIVQTVNVMFEA